MSRRSWSEMAPDTEDAWQHLAPDVLYAIRRADAEALAVQRSRVSPEVAAKLEEATYSLRNRFRYWEEMIRNLENSQYPGGRYFIDEYINNLDSRDSIDRIFATLSKRVEGALLPLLHELDQRFCQCTTYDGGIELLPWVAHLREGMQLSKRWYRKPHVIPWSH